MGWLIGWSSKKALVEHLTSDLSENNELIRHSVVGSNLWMLMFHKPTQEKFIALCLLKYVRGGGPRNNDWGYKSMDETAGPYEVNCPITMLRESTCTVESAVKWRKYAIAQHEKKKALAEAWKSVRLGDVVESGGTRVVVTNPDYVAKSIFTGRNRVPGSFLGYRESDKDKTIFRFRKSRYTPV